MMRHFFYNVRVYGSGIDIFYEGVEELDTEENIVDQVKDIVWVRLQDEGHTDSCIINIKALNNIEL